MGKPVEAEVAEKSAETEEKAVVPTISYGYPGIYGYGGLYGGYHGYPVVNSVAGKSVAPIATYPYASYGHYYGKRSADAEPAADADADAKADPWLTYGYGLGHGYGYGHGYGPGGYRSHYGGYGGYPYS